jgi:toxin ParE1/3/4
LIDHYKLLPKARADLEDIWLYSVNKWGVAQAEKYLEELEQSFKFIAENPELYPERDEFTPPVRILHHGRHLVVYLVKKDHILIIRVLHDSMDIVRHL